MKKDFFLLSAPILLLLLLIGCVTDNELDNLNKGISDNVTLNLVFDNNTIEYNKLDGQNILSRNSSESSQILDNQSNLKANLYLENAAGSEVRNTLTVKNGKATISLQPGEYKIKECDVFINDSLEYHLANLQRDSIIRIDKIDLSQISIILKKISSCNFDWENCINVLNDSNLPLLPWINSASTGVPRSISMDYKKEDGWVLLHNNFKLTNGTIPSKKFLLFYNKYSGILRMWYYHEGSSNYSALKYSIQTLYNTSILNFNQDFAKAMDVRKPAYTEYLSGDKSLPGGTGLTDKTWYMFNFEIAFDDQCIKIPSNQNDLMISARGIVYSELKLSGSQTGSINGEILFNSPNSSLFNIQSLNFNNSSTKDNNTKNSIPNETNVDARTNSGQEWLNKISSSITSGVSGAVQKVAGALSSNILNLAISPIGNFLNSLVHRGTATNAAVNLSLSTRIEITGYLTTQEAVSCTNLYIPGLAANDVEYIYNKPIGVFNLSTTPIVKYQQTYWKNAPQGPKYYQYFDIDKSSFNFAINPIIKNEITVLSSKTYLMFYKRYEGGTKLNPVSELYQPIVEKGYLVYETKPKSLSARVDDGCEYYIIREGAIPPNAGVPCGIKYDGRMIPEFYFDNATLIDADPRVVIKAELQFKINKTGRIVTIIKTFLPKFVLNQVIAKKY